MLGYRAGKKIKAVYRPPLPLVFFSLILGCLCFFVFLFFSGVNPNSLAEFRVPETRESFLILTLDKNIPSRLVAEQLINAGFTEFYSESTTQIYMDNFGQWQIFFLDEYNDRVKPFDPRDSGYAERLRSFFVNDDGQHFFIPLGNAINYGTLEKNIAQAMGTAPFSMEILGPVNPYLLWFILQFAAVLCVFLLSKEKLRFIMYIPLLLAFSLGAIPGIILSGLLIGFSELLKEPLKELFSREPYGNLKERFSPYKKTLGWLLVLLILYIFLAIILDIHIFPAFFGLICYICIIVLSFSWNKKTYRKKKDAHSSFSPVVILHFKQKSVILPKSMAIFALFALLGTFLLFIPGLSSYFIRSERKDFPNLPSAYEYYEYMTFQSLFSYLPLGAFQGEYLDYYLGEDGLIAGSINPQINLNPEIPVFPLERLTQFLLNYEDDSKDSPIEFIKEWVSVALILLLFIPRFLF